MLCLLGVTSPSEQPSDDLMNTLVSAMRKGNELYDNKAAEGLKLDLLSITEGIRLWPDLGIQPKPQHDFAFRSPDHAKNLTKSISETILSDDLIPRVHIKSPFTVSVVVGR